ncbi:MAG: GNAT family N-acetyltransferase [Steroidobacteraceae bacterium]|jgi:RimJ/RimL family protein N-acetyltransferase|nr:GNAT family N-acetyltransferase [Steroidobacteraceae bacterium]
MARPTAAKPPARRPPALDLPQATARLSLREFTLGDLPALAGWSADPRVTRHLLFGPRDAAAARRHLEEVLEAQSARVRRFWELAIERASDGVVIGACDLTLRSREELEVGYLLARPYWGEGYATEALRAVVSAAFSQLGVTRVVAATAVENARSARVLERAGLRWESLLRAHARGRGRVWDVNVYCVGRDDWLSGNGA